MARVTVEDCVDKVDNRFKLVLLASHRARLIAGGAPLTVERDRDKNPVVALREIAEGTVLPDDLEEEFVTAQQKYVEVDEPETDATPLLAGTAAPKAGSPDTDVQFDRMSEDEMLAGLEALVPPAPKDDEEG